MGFICAARLQCDAVPESRPSDLSRGKVIDRIVVERAQKTAPAA